MQCSHRFIEIDQSGPLILEHDLAVQLRNRWQADADIAFETPADQISPFTDLKSAVKAFLGLHHQVISHAQGLSWAYHVVAAHRAVCLQRA